MSDASPGQLAKASAQEDSKKLISALCAVAAWSEKELAAKLGYTAKSETSKIKNGKKILSYPAVVRLCHRHGISQDEVCTRAFGSRYTRELRPLEFADPCAGYSLDRYADFADEMSATGGIIRQFNELPIYTFCSEGALSSLEGFLEFTFDDKHEEVEKLVGRRQSPPRRACLHCFVTREYMQSLVTYMKPFLAFSWLHEVRQFIEADCLRITIVPAIQMKLRTHEVAVFSGDSMIMRESTEFRWTKDRDAAIAKRSGLLASVSDAPTKSRAASLRVVDSLISSSELEIERLYQHREIPAVYSVGV